MAGLIQYVPLNTAAWAGPIDYTRVSDRVLFYSIVFTLVILAVTSALSIWALFKYQKKRKQDGRGWPIWAVVAAVGAAVLFWTAVFVWQVMNGGARYIG